MNVTQQWIESLTLMQQTVLLTALRGPDTLPKFHVSKFLLRWFRRCVVVSAFDRCALTDPRDPRGGSFTGPIGESSLDEIASKYLRAIDEIPIHFHMHLVHAAEILGYKHPDPPIREWWYRFYAAAVRDLHLHVETVEELDRRLGDNLDQWQKLGGEGEALTGRLPREKGGK